MLAGLGVRLVVVNGCQADIDELLLERNLKPAYVGGYRVTDKEALKISIEAAGAVRTSSEQMLSKVCSYDFEALGFIPGVMSFQVISLSLSWLHLLG